MSDKPRRPIGALWNRVSRNGLEYMSGTFEGKQVVAFKNDKADNPKRPDWQIFPQIDRYQEAEREPAQKREEGERGKMETGNEAYGDNVPF